ncbi:hypothetical protein Y032_0129g1479 [Ancylostoma ceylanicum]|uniref:Uncharacterized protein n=1 Tax=Ancylostoma ceylanicum TaxID=53326 RepID=A0A016T6S5_9BILA|nr:hypothetical protein Y032_0129g1479 [Ancylostoma ceylanicum]
MCRQTAREHGNCYMLSFYRFPCTIQAVIVKLRRVPRDVSVKYVHLSSFSARLKLKTLELLEASIFEVLLYSNLFGLVITER